jgi:arginyl-tRNA synthetase
MSIFREIRRHVIAALDEMVAAGALPAGLDFGRVNVEPPRDPSHGDMATNAAMVLAKPAGGKPREIAEALAGELAKRSEIELVEVAGPGFINLRLDPALWRRCIGDVLAVGTAYGSSDTGRSAKVNVEYVSANPTGLLHMGHARGAVFGDALASLLAKVGYDVTREYYVNDAGNQIDILAESLIKRGRQLTGETVPDSEFEGLYPGEEVIDAARAASEENPDWLSLSNEDRNGFARKHAVAYLMVRIREDLGHLGIEQEIYSSEAALVAAGAVDRALETLESRGLIYTGVLEPPKGKKPDDWEERPQTLFRATDFGDDVDRPLKKSNGEWTYFATDIAYHLDKYRRGFATLIDVWGADHGGYVKRMKAAVDAITEGQAALDVKICQLVNLMDKGEPVKMSKRAGNVVTIREVVDEIGKDVVRFIMLTRKNDAPLDFDFAKVTEQSKDNPVFYVQYAHARVHSVFRQASAAIPDLQLDDESLAGANLELLTDPGELTLIKTIAGWPRIVESAAEAHEPHRLAFYLNDTAAEFHAHWNRGKDEAGLRFVVDSDRELTLARLAMIRALALVIASGLEAFGVMPVEEMR